MSDHQDRKEQAIAYYQQNKVPLRMQDVLNVMFQANPLDVNGYVSTYFEDLAQTPTITRTFALRYMDSKGSAAIGTKIYCLVRNKELLVGQSQVAVDTELADNVKVEDIEAEDEYREHEVEEAIILINNDFREILASANPRNQQELDEKLYQLVEKRRSEAKQQDEQRNIETTTPVAADDGKKGAKKSAKGSGKKKNSQVPIVPDRPKEKAYPGSSAVTALSQSLCQASASLSSLSVYDHLISCFGGDDYSITLPLPMITLAQSGKAALGKCNCIKEFMIVPRSDMPMQDAVAAAAKFQESMVKAAFSKGGIIAKNLNDFGAVCPVLDKPEQGLDMVTDIVAQHGFEMGKDFFFILNAAAQEFFDYEKGKYELTTGALKASEDMADFWADLCTRYPAIVGIIEPVRGEEMEQWNKVCSSVSDHCLVIADRSYERPGLLKERELNFAEFATSGVVLRLSGCTTISQVVECSKKLIDLNNTVILAEGQHETNDATLVDVAIACRARFIKLGAPSRGERVSKYNRLIDLDGELGERRAQWKDLEFPTIPPKLPTPLPETDETGDNAEN
ncbi:enolase 4-like [Watersipora subatra]|uniref:enolase 4-like n=1 Tax=Watersipora subatra TaxID=2589382 RepID=UPI00355BCEA1